MANYLKLNKSYIGNDILENPEFNMLGPNLPNFNFSEIADGTDVSSLSDWSLLGTPTATIEGGKLKVVCSGSSQAARFSATGLTVDKVYNLSFTAEGDLSNDSVSVSGYSVVSAIGGKGEFYFKAQSSSATLYFSANNTSYPATVEYSGISLKETGQVEYVSNPYFKGVPSGTDVTTLTGWSNYGSPTSNNVIAASSKNKLEIVATGGGQGAQLDISSIPNGMEVNFKVEEITGDLGARGIFIEGDEDIDTSSGSVDYTFVKQSNNSAIFFRAGDNTAGTTEYYNISIQPTNVFAYAWNRGGSGVSASGENAVFNGGTVTLTTLAGSSNAIIGTETPSYLSGSELIIKFNVLSKSDGVIFQIYDRVNYLTVDAELGENEFRYKAAANGTNLLVNVKSTGATDEFITLDNIGLQEVKNQPKLIGVDNVSTVSAPTNSTVVINNGLTDGADTITITYAEADATSTVQMRNFFQDAIVESANANNTGKVIEIKSPVLINDIVAS